MNRVLLSPRLTMSIATKIAKYGVLDHGVSIEIVFHLPPLINYKKISC